MCFSDFPQLHPLARFAPIISFLLKNILALIDFLL